MGRKLILDDSFVSEQKEPPVSDWYYIAVRLEIRN